MYRMCTRMQRCYLKMHVFQRMRTFKHNVLSRIETKVDNTTAVHLAALMSQNEVQTHNLPSQNNNKKGIK